MFRKALAYTQLKFERALKSFDAAHPRFQFDLTDETYERDSYDILRALRPRFGPAFSIDRSVDVPDIKPSPFGFFFWVDGVKVTLPFTSHHLPYPTRQPFLLGLSLFLDKLYVPKA